MTAPPIHPAYPFSFFLPSPPYSYGPGPSGTDAYFAALLGGTSTAREGREEREESFGPERPPEMEEVQPGKEEGGKDQGKGKERAVEEEKAMEETEEEDDWFAARLTHSPSVSRSRRASERAPGPDSSPTTGETRSASRSKSRGLYKPEGRERATKGRDGRRREESRGRGWMWREDIENDKSHWSTRGRRPSRSRSRSRSRSPLLPTHRRRSASPPRWRDDLRSPSPPPFPPSRPSFSSFHGRRRSFSPPPHFRRRSPSPRRHAFSPPPSPPHRNAPPPARLPLFQSDNLRLPLRTLQERLSFVDYERFLLQSAAVDPHWSTAYHGALMRFLVSLSPRENWSSRPTAPSFSPPSFTATVEKVQEAQPNFKYIRKAFPLGRLASPPRGRDEIKWAAMMEVVRWVWGVVPDGWENVAWAVQELPLPLVALLRTFADASRYRLAIFFAWRECTTYLLTTVPTTISCFTPRERRGRLLLKWLEQGGDARKVFFFCDEDLRPVGPQKRPAKGGKVEEGWEWWFDLEEGEATVGALEAWEKRERYRRRLGQ
ncbi:hypothetical protein JCM6882_003480 [Rhodosporidiobolus microsporus]